MLSFSGNLEVYLAIGPCDMRKNFNGLYALTEAPLQFDPKSGAIFVFANKRRNSVKILDAFERGELDSRWSGGIFFQLAS